MVDELLHEAMKGSNTGSTGKASVCGAAGWWRYRGWRRRFDGGGEMGDGSCCVRCCIAGFQTYNTGSWKPEAFSDWGATLAVAQTER